MSGKDYVSGNWRPSLPSVETAPVAGKTEIAKYGTATFNQPSALKERKTPADYSQFDNLTKLRLNLENCLQIIDDEVMKGYLSQLETLDIAEADFKNLKSMQFFRITKLVYQEDEFSLYNVATLYRTLSDKPCALALMVKSDGENVEFYLGVRANGNNSTATMRKMLEDSLKGLFPGSQVAEYDNEALNKDMDSIEFGAVSAVTSVADFRQEKSNLNDRTFAQGLEKFILSMKNRKYRAVFIADSLCYDELMNVKRGYEDIYSQISPFAKMDMNFSLSSSKGESFGKSQSDTKGTGKTLSLNVGTQSSTAFNRQFTEGKTSTTTKGESYSVGDGVTNTTGFADTATESESNSHTLGRSSSIGGFIGVMIPGTPFGGGVNMSRSHNESDTRGITHGSSHTINRSDSISRTLTRGFNDSTAEGVSRSAGVSVGNTNTQSEGRGEATSENQSQTLTDSVNFTDTLGDSQGITLTAENKTFSSLLERLQKELNRIEECESLGMWNFAAYFIGDGADETATAASIYRSIVSGKNSGVECSAVNTWHEKSQVQKISEYIKRFTHPVFNYESAAYEGNSYEITPAVLVSTPELAIHMGLPHSSVKGLPVVNHASFAQEAIALDDSENKDEIIFGKITHMGEISKTDVKLDLNSLTSHLFITGSTGSGKSNAIYKLLGEIKDKGKKFLVIEPAKGEYRKIFPDARVLCANPKIGELLRINPFAFPKTIHVLEHIDRLVEIFNVCWPMYAAMPAILKDATIRAYENSGWDLELSENNRDIFPNFSDIAREVRQVLNESEYSAENKGDYVGSLITRLNSLTNGINKLIFSSSISDREIFDENVIIDLSRIGSVETKSLIMGLLVLKLTEHRMDEREQGGELNSGLRHITVLEEAHNLLKRTNTEQAAESANLTGKSVEMLSNSIAEMRTYGEGFIIADQSPGKLDLSVIRNTNTKIILRLPDLSDRELVGRAAGLNDAQIEEIIKLPKGVAVINQIDWLEPALVKIPLHEPPTINSTQKKLPTHKRDNLEERLFGFIMTEPLKDGKLRAALKHLEHDILTSSLSGKFKKDLFDYIDSGSAVALSEFLNGFFNGEEALQRLWIKEKNSEDICALTKKLAESFKITQYQPKQIDDIIGLILLGAARNNRNYESLAARFTEEHKESGGVYAGDKK